jgi:site-specific DNA-methyltransferase (adenine-specific)
MKQEIDKRNGVWVTPKSFFEPLRAEFDLRVDAAASPDNAMLPVFFCDGIRDAFKQDWSDLRVWCNPPYGRKEIYKWVERCARGGANVVVALLPARTDTRWFHDFIYKKPGVKIRFVKGRIKFSGTAGAGKFPSMVVIFSKTT